MAAFDIQGALKEGYSAREINDYLVSKRGYKFDLAGARKEGYSDDEILNHLSGLAPAEEQPAQPQAEAPAAPAPAQTEAPRPQPPIQLELENPVEGEDYEAPTEGERAVVDALSKGDVVRGLGLGTRNVLQGITAPQALINPLYNAAVDAIGLPSLRADKTAGQAISDALGLPTPQTRGERILSAAEEFAAGGIPFIGAGTALSRAASPVAQGVGKFLSAAPVEQLAGGAAAGAASEAVKENGGDGAAQLLAGIAAGMTPSLAASAARIGSRAAGTAAQALDIFSDAGRDRAAGRILARAAGGNTDDLIRAAENDATEIVAGSKPTLGQVYPGENLATLEKGVASSGQGQPLQERYMAQAAARERAVDDAVSSANARLAAEREAAASNLPTGINADEAGPIIRGAYDRNYNAARQATRRAYEAVDPDGTALFDLQPLYEANARIIGNSAYSRVPAEVQSIQTQIANDIRHGLPANYADMQAMRTTLTDMAETAARNGDAATARIAQGMKRNIDDYLGTQGTQAGFTPEQAQRFDTARRTRLEQGRNFETGVNRDMGRSGSTLTGEKVSDTAVAGKYFSKGRQGSENIRAFRRMANGDQRAENALRDYARGLLHSAAIGPDGVMRSAKIAQFRKDYAAALREMPDLEREVTRLEQFVRRQERQTEGLRAVARRNGDGWRMQRNVDLQDAAGGRFGPQGTGTFTPDELDALAAAQRDAQRAQRATQVAQVKGSPTAQLMATQDLARRFWGERPAAGNQSWLGSMLGNMIEGAASKLYGGTNDALNQRLASAFLDPGYATYLLRMAQAGMRNPRENLLDLLARSTAAGANVSARTAAAVNE